MLDKKEAREVAERYATAVTEVLSPDAIIFYGSYLNGTPHEGSCVDIGVFYNNFCPSVNWGEIMAQLGALVRRTWDEPDLYVMPCILDIFNDPSGFAADVLEKGEILYATEGFKDDVLATA